MRVLACVIAFLAVSTVSAWAAEPVVPATDQMALLKSDDPQLAANKKLVFDMWRKFITAFHIEAADEYLSEDYHQHSPVAASGREGVKTFFKSLNLTPKPIPDTIPNLVSIVAERDLVVLSFVRDLKDSEGNPYTSTWFDMFRVKDGKIVEHWDIGTKK